MNDFNKEYKYQCQIELIGDHDKALREYLNRDNFHLWHDDLTEVIPSDNDNEYYMVYQFDKHRMEMKVNVLEFNPPHYAKAIYEVPGVWNLCIDKFEKIDDNKILWTMDVEFRFKEDQHLLIDAFIRKTYAGMNIFKAYFENKKNE